MKVLTRPNYTAVVDPGQQSRGRFKLTWKQRGMVSLRVQTVGIQLLPTSFFFWGFFFKYLVLWKRVVFLSFNESCLCVSFVFRHLGEPVMHQSWRITSTLALLHSQFVSRSHMNNWVAVIERVSFICNYETVLRFALLFFLIVWNVGVVHENPTKVTNSIEFIFYELDLMVILYGFSYRKVQELVWIWIWS